MLNGKCTKNDHVEQDGLEMKELRLLRERILRWRKSIYDEQFQAVPLGNGMQVGYSGVEEWIIRELQAVTGVQDPTIIAYMMIPIYKRNREKKQLWKRRNIWDL
ncbi:hypothetical protein POM88_007031 [Heracleum sosnowskyi]|uniref:Uncharacterized protein n=1 Tax=Heracleum sosnowskyi TaxID=360622 RepID=A0AAD8J5Z4_9APIA|nr:hypothetical protein POM88_007031 [Heracleum sosnowskyi]